MGPQHSSGMTAGLIEGTAPADMAPNMTHNVPRRSRPCLTVQQGLLDQRWASTFSGVLSNEALAEYLDIWEATEHVTLNDAQGRVIWHWTSDGLYSAKSVYNTCSTLVQSPSTATP